MSFLDLIFGCRHKRISFPLGKKEKMYVVCLDCGKEYEYDWQLMKMGKQKPLKPYRAAVEIQAIPEPRLTACSGVEELERMMR